MLMNRMIELWYFGFVENLKFHRWLFELYETLFYAGEIFLVLAQLHSSINQK